MLRSLPEVHRERLAHILSQHTAELSPDSESHVESLHATFLFQGYIPDTEHRGITLQQLSHVVEYVAVSCEKRKDLSPPQYSRTSGLPVSMEWASLYHVNVWLIMPATRKNDCAFVELRTGQRQVPKWFISHWWGGAHTAFPPVREAAPLYEGLGVW